MITNINRKRSVMIDNLKAFACILVVLQHCLSYVVRNHNPIPFLVSLYGYVGVISVPLFFIASGYLLHIQPIKQYYRKKASKILIPFFVFTALKLVYSLFVNDAFAHGGGVVEQLINAFIYGDLYWFSYSILIMFLVAPLFWRTKRFSGGNCEHPIACVVLFAVLLLFNFLNEQFDLVNLPKVFQIGSTVENLPFFLLGYILKFYFPRNIITILRKRPIISIVVIAVSSGLALLLGDPKSIKYLPYFLMTLCLAIIVFCIATYFKKENRCLAMIAKYTYQVFFLDSFVKVVIFSILEIIFSSVFFDSYLCFLIVGLEVTFNICISVMITAFAEKIPVMRKMFGF